MRAGTIRPSSTRIKKPPRFAMISWDTNARPTCFSSAGLQAMLVTRPAIFPSGHPRWKNCGPGYQHRLESGTGETRRPCVRVPGDHRKPGRFLYSRGRRTDGAGAHRENALLRSRRRPAEIRGLMMNATRTSPLHDQVAELNPQWSVVRSMRTAAGLAGDETGARESVAVADLSCLDKAGIKGPEAARWLESLGIAVPAKANAWTGLPGGGVIARLGRAEFFLEDGATGDRAGRVRDVLGTGIAGVYPVIRQDAGIALVGRRVNELLVQTCNVNFQEV